MVRRGFIGPIGEDLPSLIPLLLALVIFFSAFTFTFTIFGSKSSDFDADLAALSVARVMRSTSYISSEKEFFSLCNSLSIFGLRFRALITDEFTKPGASGQLDFSKPESSITVLNGEALDCTNKPEEEQFPEIGGREAAVIVKVYPIALEDNRIVKPMHLVVLAWR